MTFQPSLVVDNEDLRAPKDAALLNSLATVHAQFGMYTAALEITQLSNWIKPRQRTTLQLMAEAFMHLHKPQDALTVLDAYDAIAKDDAPNDHMMTLRGNCLAMLGRFEEARTILNASPHEDDDDTLQQSISK